MSNIKEINELKKVIEIHKKMNFYLENESFSNSNVVYFEKLISEFKTVNEGLLKTYIKYIKEIVNLSNKKNDFQKTIDKLQTEKEKSKIEDESIDPQLEVVGRYDDLKKKISRLNNFVDEIQINVDKAELNLSKSIKKRLDKVKEVVDVLEEKKDLLKKIVKDLIEEINLVDIKIFDKLIEQKTESKRKLKESIDTIVEIKQKIVDINSKIETTKIQLFDLNERANKELVASSVSDVIEEF